MTFLILIYAESGAGAACYYVKICHLWAAL